LNTGVEKSPSYNPQAHLPTKLDPKDVSWKSLRWRFLHSCTTEKASRGVSSLPPPVRTVQCKPHATWSQQPAAAGQGLPSCGEGTKEQGPMATYLPVKTWN